MSTWQASWSASCLVFIYCKYWQH